MVDSGRRRCRHCRSILEIRTSLVRSHRRGAVASGAAWLSRRLVSARRPDRGRGGGDCHCNFVHDPLAGLFECCNMRTLGIVLAAFLISAASFAADQTAAGTNSKLSVMLAAKDANGKPIITPEEQTYFNGLNDNLRAQLSELVQKEVITRPEHLAILLGLQLRPQKMEVLLQNRCVLCHTDFESQSAENLFSVATSSRKPEAHMNLKDVVEDVHFRRGVSCAGCHGGDPAADFGHDFVKEWPEKDRQKNRAWVVQFCARCHSDPAKMHEFNPSLPTDQLAKF